MPAPVARLDSPLIDVTRRRDSAASFIVETADQGFWRVGDDTPAFVVRVPSERFWHQLWSWDAYRTGLAFVNGAFDIEGDLVAALRLWGERRSRVTVMGLLRALLVRVRVEHWIQSPARARRNIQFHYDRSNDFYRTFLDERLVYSCAYFERETDTLERAQLAKLHHVCRKLDLVRGESFLDVGCGWGALVALAAQDYGAGALGCTLSREQEAAARTMLSMRGLSDRARVELVDYRQLHGTTFDKIASVGMVEHVGRSRLRAYFQTLARLVADDGLVLNHGIVRPPHVVEDAASLFLQHRVFPGGELPRHRDVVGRRVRRLRGAGCGESPAALCADLPALGPAPAVASIRVPGDGLARDVPNMVALPGGIGCGL